MAAPAVTPPRCGTTGGSATRLAPRTAGPSRPALPPPHADRRSPGRARAARAGAGLRPGSGAQERLRCCARRRHGTFAGPGGAPVRHLAVHVLNVRPSAARQELQEQLRQPLGPVALKAVPRLLHHLDASVRPQTAQRLHVGVRNSGRAASADQHQGRPRARQARPQGREGRRDAEHLVLVEASQVVPLGPGTVLALPGVVQDAAPDRHRVGAAWPPRSRLAARTSPAAGRRGQSAGSRPHGWRGSRG